MVDGDDVNLYPYDTGSFTRPITTSSPNAQQWFKHGLTWCYAFHHLEAERCFEYALKADPGCAMGYWGLAYAVGPNYNKPWEMFDVEDLERTLRRGRKALEDAKGLLEGCTGVEKGLILALEKRFDGGVEDYKIRNEAYAEEMKKVYEKHSEDLDVVALYADSLMNLGAWDLWDIQTGLPRSEYHTAEIQGILELPLHNNPLLTHPGILHFYTHLMEMSPTPEIALIPSYRLLNLVPDGGHLHHMPSHLDLLVGDYRNAIKSNLLAIKSDEKYARLSSSNDFYTFYRLHDYNTLIYAAMLGGEYEVAMKGVEGMERALPESLLRRQSPPMADWLEVAWTTRAHVYVRFGKWKEILEMSLPDDQELYCVTTATIHYAKGIAYSVLGDIPSALSSQTSFEASLLLIPDTRMDFPNKCTGILEIASAMLKGEITYRQDRNSPSIAFTHLREAIRLSDNLTYSEPWGWKQPPRHAYGALMLESGNVEEAERVYAEDLGLGGDIPRAQWHPKNVWALHGYHECLERMRKGEEAEKVKVLLDEAVGRADIGVESSCFCRTVKGDCCG
jgi:tetratricopeptide (TPR) repeat protein